MELQRGGEQVVLAAEVVVERALGHAGLRGDRLERHAHEAVAIEQRVGRLEDAPPRPLPAFVDRRCRHVYRGVSLPGAEPP